MLSWDRSLGFPVTGGLQCGQQKACKTKMYKLSMGIYLSENIKAMTRDAKVTGALTDLKYEL